MAFEPTAPAHPSRLGGWVAAWRAPVVVVGVAVAARLLYWLLVVPDYEPDSDALQYHYLAVSLSRGDGFADVFPALDLHPTAFRPPLWPFLLGGLYTVFGEHEIAGQVANLVLGVGVVVLVWWLARRLAGSVAGLAAGVVAALYPPLVANDVTLLTEPLSLALMLGMLLALSYRRWWLAGLLCGLLVLARPSAQFLVVVLVVWVLWQFGWRRALGVLGVVAVVVMPWVVRNWAQLGSPVLVTSNGFNWAAMYSPQAQETEGFVDAVNDPRFDEYRLVQQDEVEWQDELTRLALSNIRRDPTQVFGVWGRNTLAYLELDPAANEGAETFDGRNLDFRAAVLPAFYVVTVLGVAGLALRWRDPLVALVLVAMGYWMVSSVVFIAVPRLRAPFDVLCCLGVGLLVAQVAERRRQAPRAMLANLV